VRAPSDASLHAVKSKWEVPSLMSIDPQVLLSDVSDKQVLFHVLLPAASDDTLTIQLSRFPFADPANRASRHRLPRSSDRRT
jgi:hypothetical protein